MSDKVREDRSIPQLLSDAFTEVGDLLKTEVHLVRADISDKIRQVEIGGGSIAAGAICLLVSLIVLAQAMIVALGNYIGDAWAALAIGVALAAIGVALLIKGKADLNPKNLTPDRAANQLRKDAAMVKEQAQ